MNGQLESGISNEFRLVCACSIWPPSDRRNATITEATAVINWDKLVRVATRHRVVGLVHNGLKQAGAVVAERAARTLADAAMRQLQLNVRFAGEVVRLQSAFEQEGLPVTFFKGVLTSIDLYGDLGIRHAKDLDLLVAKSEMSRAERVLNSIGYCRTDPPTALSEARIRTIMSTGKDFIYAHTEVASLQVELHWRLFNNATFMAGLSTSTRTYAPLNNARLRTFGGDDLFAYLCAHGAAFAWCRLKWLADIGAILSRETPEGVVRLYEAANARGAARPAAQAILLCHRLLGIHVPQELIVKLKRDRSVRRLEQLALKAMTQGGAETEPYDLRGGMIPIAASLWLLGGTPRYLLGELNSRWISWDDVVDVALPPGLQFLYPVLRVPLWVWRRARRAAGITA